MLTQEIITQIRPNPPLKLVRKFRTDKTHASTVDTFIRSKNHRTKAVQATKELMGSW